MFDTLTTRVRLTGAALTVAIAMVAPGITSAQDAAAGPQASAEPDPSGSPAATTLRPDTSWTVLSFDAEADGLQPPRDPGALTVELLVANLLQGETGCGTYVGNYGAEGLSVGLSVTTKGPDPCEPPVEDEAIAFIEALERATTWRASGSDVELLDDDGVVRVVLAPLSEPGVVGEWRVTAYARPNGTLRAAPDDGSMRLVLDDDDRVSGSTGCRLFEGQYSSEVDRILVVPIDITGLPCEGPARRAERLLLAALELAVLWQRDGEVLRLTDAQGRSVVELEATVASPDEAGFEGEAESDG